MEGKRGVLMEYFEEEFGTAKKGLHKKQKNNTLNRESYTQGSPECQKGVIRGRTTFCDT